MIELHLPISEEQAQQLEDFFCEEYQQRWMLYEDSSTMENQLRGFFDNKETMHAALAELKAEFPDLTGNPEFVELEDQDWREAYKEHFKPWSERGLHWVPIWEKDHYKLPKGDEIVYLDPGMAFGTGNHETTRLCVMRLLDARDAWKSKVKQKRVIDAGCGSGILAISARKLGFGEVYGFDSDPNSIEVSIGNEQLCGLQGEIEFRWANLKEGLKRQSCDLLLANILANVLCEHARALCRCIRPGGRLALSGILAREVEEVHAKFAPIIEKITGNPPAMDSRQEGDWADLLYQF